MMDATQLEKIKWGEEERHLQIMNMERFVCYTAKCKERCRNGFIYKIKSIR